MSPNFARNNSSVGRRSARPTSPAGRPQRVAAVPARPVAVPPKPVVKPGRVMSVGHNLTARGSLAAAQQPKRSPPQQIMQPSAADTAAKAKAAQDDAQPDTGPRVAIVHDWLIGGGAELVVEQLHVLFPDAPIFTSYCTREWRDRLNGKVRTGFLQHWPLSKLRKFLPVLRIWWFTHLDFRDYDIVISSSGAEAKGVRVPRSAIHINYCHAPTHYYWSRYHEYLDNPGFGPFNWLARRGLKLLVGRLRKWDYKAAQRPDYMIANSSHIKAEIEKYYDRSSTVINPPVYTERFKAHLGTKKRRGYLVAGRQTPYKRFDLAVVACSKLDLPLTVIGNGPEHRRLKKLAGKSVTFLGKVSDDVMAEELASAKALLFPGLDDFGIMAVEALAAGTPVIAYEGGGAKDYLVPHKTGLFFDEPTTKSLAIALRQFGKENFASADIARFAERFSRETFRRKVRLFIKKATADL